jgi:hypothetical protein
MARNLQPRSALTPPRSPAPINATRPDFPVRAGQFLGGTHPPTRTGPAWQPPAWQFFPITNWHSLCSAEADYDVGGDSARNPARRIAVSSQSLLARAPDTITHREQRSIRPRHVGTAIGTCTRGRRAEMARPGRAPMRVFSRVPSQRAVAALLQRRAILRAPARGHSAEREMGGGRGVPNRRSRV